MRRIDDTEDPRRRLVVKALTMWLTALATSSRAASAADVFGNSPAKLPPGQSIYRISGGATVNGKEATLATLVAGGDTVATGKNSEIVFAVGGTAMILRGDSKLTIESAPGNSLLLSLLRLVTGKVLSVHALGHPVRIETPTATVGIRGTGIYCEADPAQSYVCTCYGVTDIAANDDSESRETVVATHHNRPLYIVAGAKPGNSIRLAPFINHTDQELMLIETLVGRTVPFVFPSNLYETPRRQY
jgi:FecR-like protein